MKILGIRTSPTTVRYAVIEWNGSTVSLVNASSENRLKFPADCQCVEKKLHWLHQELLRILRHYPDIARVGIKANEYGRGGESTASREAAYFDAVVLMVAGENSLPVETKLYRSIGTKRDDVNTFATANVGITSKYWDVQIADAVAVAWSVREN